jgi:glycosylphosphatidylinositol transamidase
MPPSLPQFSAARLRSYVLRLPLFTRAIILVIIVLWIAGMQTAWDIRQWGALIPKEIGIATSKIIVLIITNMSCARLQTYMASTVYRTNTFPLIHAGFLHAFLNLVTLTPLLERFEAEHGTLTTFALFMGRRIS